MAKEIVRTNWFRSGNARRAIRNRIIENNSPDRRGARRQILGTGGLELRVNNNLINMHFARKKNRRRGGRSSALVTIYEHHRSACQSRLSTRRIRALGSRYNQSILGSINQGFTCNLCVDRVQNQCL